MDYAGRLSMLERGIAGASVRAASVEAALQLLDTPCGGAEGDLEGVPGVSAAQLAVCVRVLLTIGDNSSLERGVYRARALRPLRTALAPLIAHVQSAMHLNERGEPVGKEAWDAARRRGNEARKVRQREAAHDRQWINNTALRAGRIARQAALQRAMPDALALEGGGDVEQQQQQQKKLLLPAAPGASAAAAGIVDPRRFVVPDGPGGMQSFGGVADGAAAITTTASTTAALSAAAHPADASSTDALEREAMASAASTAGIALSALPQRFAEDHAKARAGNARGRMVFGHGGAQSAATAATVAGGCGGLSGGADKVLAQELLGSADGAQLDDAGVAVCATAVAAAATDAAAAAAAAAAGVGPQQSPALLSKPRACYVCRRRFTLLHHFYDRLCPQCAGAPCRALPRRISSPAHVACLRIAAAAAAAAAADGRCWCVGAVALTCSRCYSSQISTGASVTRLRTCVVAYASLRARA